MGSLGVERACGRVGGMGVGDVCGGGDYPGGLRW